MRPRNQTARDLLPVLLARRAGRKAADLATELGVSVPTLHRLIANTDMHAGNLAFRPGDRLQTAPAYDRLPNGYKRSHRHLHPMISPIGQNLECGPVRAMQFPHSASFRYPHRAARNLAV